MGNLHCGLNSNPLKTNEILNHSQKDHLKLVNWASLEAKCYSLTKSANWYINVLRTEKPTKSKAKLARKWQAFPCVIHYIQIHTLFLV